MSRFRHLLFVCTNTRDPNDPKGCCASKGSKQLLDRLKALTAEHGLKGQVRVTSSGCLDYCAKGCAVVVFSEGLPKPETWYTRLIPNDADALFEQHILRGERLGSHVEERRPAAVAAPVGSK